MKTITPLMQVMLEARTATMAMGWLIVRTDGQVFAFTDHDRDVVFNLEAAILAWGYAAIPDLTGTGERTYLSTPGYVNTDVENTAALNVDNMEIHGLLLGPSLTLDDVRAGLWDYAGAFVFYFNWAERTGALAISSLTRISGNAIAVTAVAHGLSDDDVVEISGAAETEYNGLHAVNVTSPVHFEYSVSGAPATPATGTITYEARFGPIMLRVGKIGEVSVDGGTFKAELRGLAQYYSRTIGQITSPSCRADLGDARCTVDLTGGTSPNFTVTGTLESASADGGVLYDSNRTEPGPDDGIAITGITNANPGKVTLAAPVPFVTGEPVTISGVIGMALLNTTVQVDNPSGNTFELRVDTSDTAVWGTYSSGGTVYPLGATAGYFDGGLITILDGPNAGFGREVKSYVPGQITVWLPFPYPFGSPLPSYTLHVGCDKAFTTCRDKFNNVLNFRGEPYLPGVDQLVQVGRHG